MGMPTFSPAPQALRNRLELMTGTRADGTTYQALVLAGHTTHLEPRRDSDGNVIYKDEAKKKPKWQEVVDGRRQVIGFIDEFDGRQRVRIDQYDKDAGKYVRHQVDVTEAIAGFLTTPTKDDQIKL